MFTEVFKDTGKYLGLNPGPKRKISRVGWPMEYMEPNIKFIQEHGQERCYSVATEWLLKTTAIFK